MTDSEVIRGSAWCDYYTRDDSGDWCELPDDYVCRAVTCPVHSGMPLEEIDRIAEKPWYMKERMSMLASMTVPTSHIRRRVDVDDRNNRRTNSKE